MEFDPHTRLAGECLQPLGHLSRGRTGSLEAAGLPHDLSALSGLRYLPAGSVETGSRVAATSDQATTLSGALLPGLAGKTGPEFD
jgi:hypothetical protein